jgi:hypothetical protein
MLTNLLCPGFRGQGLGLGFQIQGKVLCVGQKQCSVRRGNN